MPSRLVDLMNDVAANLGEPGELADTLARITRAAQETVPGVAHASISLRHADGRLETKAATNPLVDEADQIQHDLAEGPCYDAVTDSLVTYSPDLAHATEWPRYGPKAAALGFRSQMAFRLYEKGAERAGLNLYSLELHAFEDSAEIAALFASHARVALGHAQDRDSLSAAITTREDIGKAVGIVMERYQLTGERGFELLIRLSQTSNIKLRDVAAQILESSRTEQAPQG